MSCYKCLCNFCARSSELYPSYFTPREIGDVELICYTCEECIHYDGKAGKSQKHLACDGYREAQKHIELKAIAEQHMAKRRAAWFEEYAKELRRNFTVIQGGKEIGD